MVGAHLLLENRKLQEWVIHFHGAGRIPEN